MHAVATGSARLGSYTCAVKILAETIPGPAGELEGLLTLPEQAAAGQPRWVAVVCHPHPLYGGTLHNKVVFHVTRALAGLGWPALRFNYRGVGRSAGKLEQGTGTAALLQAASEDLQAALDWLHPRFPGAPICAAGFSFGALTVLQVAHSDARLTRLLAVGTPVTMGDDPDLFSLVPDLTQPKLFIQGEADAYGPPELTRRLFEAAANPKRLVMIPGAGHFFEDKLNELREAAASVAD